MRIRLSRRSCRVYSVNTVYNSPAEAKKACAETALAEGVIDYIKSWPSSDTDMDVVDESDPSSALSLQQFFESLPQPFPEPVAGRTAVDINGPAWLNTTIQSARGGKIVPNFIYTIDPRHNCERFYYSPATVPDLLTRPKKSTAACYVSNAPGQSSRI